ncbi:MAG: hypothetical protein JNJ69_14830 [Leptospiraceae bacterium]|nr:hypothetical protein [Leptospiraceae bacterium]
MKRAALLLFSLSLAFTANAFMAPGDPTLEIAAKQGEPPVLFLKYQHHEGDYLVFYDADGSILLMRYRIDRWDYDNDTLRDSLRRGTTYKILLAKLTKLDEGQVPAGVTGSGVPRVPVVRKIRRIRELYLGEMRGINESALRDLRY